MNKFNILALANTFALIDLVLHPLFRVWIWLSPSSYEFLMNFFVAGLHTEVVPAFDLSWFNIIVSMLAEAAVFWCLGAIVALVYNWMVK
ncbi:hypothetical protein COV18_00755 [Candidatus Woesearchaeota archaeon CG10_big_fil_rev_8_21_14_0_10_37_12]|nr:MAG: hypothetical protein COV18_00755 [Candidatus Woesearchaeota archaeon CG10_big_fil_rev_8_21_14_0_10_37_12]